MAGIEMGLTSQGGRRLVLGLRFGRNCECQHVLGLGWDWNYKVMNLERGVRHPLKTGHLLEI